jgi:predicted nucleotidyltransferase
MNKTDQDKIIRICRQNDISMIAIFGSTVRGQANETSDIDLLSMKIHFFKTESFDKLKSLAKQ